MWPYSGPKRKKEALHPNFTFYWLSSTANSERQRQISAFYNGDTVDWGNPTLKFYERGVPQSDKGRLWLTWAEKKNLNQDYDLDVYSLYSLHVVLLCRVNNVIAKSYINFFFYSTSRIILSICCIHWKTIPRYFYFLSIFLFPKLHLWNILNFRQIYSNQLSYSWFIPTIPT